jgi:hypothetical protein
MSWAIVYLVISVIAGFMGIWNLARQRNVFLSLAGILWFLVVLLGLYVKQVYNYQLASGLPVVGDLLLYVLLPVLVILAFFTMTTRRS